MVNQLVEQDAEPLEEEKLEEELSEKSGRSLRSSKSQLLELSERGLESKFQ